MKRWQRAKLSHPNLALCDTPGVCLADVLAKCGPLEVERVRALAHDLCAGLHAAHGGGVGHGRLLQHPAVHGAACVVTDGHMGRRRRLDHRALRR